MCVHGGEGGRVTVACVCMRGKEGGSQWHVYTYVCGEEGECMCVHFCTQ